MSESDMFMWTRVNYIINAASKQPEVDALVAEFAEHSMRLESDTLGPLIRTLVFVKDPSSWDANGSPVE